MTKIHFRIWHKKENRWLDPWAEEDPTLSLRDCGKGCEVSLYDRELEGGTNRNCLMKDIVIQQWIGIQDKNGEGIYEGDIIKFDPDIRDSVDSDCIWKNLGHVWIDNIVDGVVVSYNHPYSEMSNKLSEVIQKYCENNVDLKYEIVGNIFENPECFDEAI